MVKDKTAGTLALIGSILFVILGIVIFAFIGGNYSDGPFLYKSTIESFYWWLPFLVIGIFLLYKGIKWIK